MRRESVSEEDEESESWAFAAQAVEDSGQQELRSGHGEASLQKLPETGHDGA